MAIGAVAVSARFDEEGFGPADHGRRVLAGAMISSIVMAAASLALTIEVVMATAQSS